MHGFYLLKCLRTKPVITNFIYFDVSKTFRGWFFSEQLML